MNNWRHFWIWMLVALGLDQLSKVAIVHMLGLKTLIVVEVWRPYLVLRMGWNRGINFGLFSADGDAGRWVLIAISVIICAVVIWWVRSETRALAWVSAGLLVGGALGNVVDRVIYGAVADFLNMSCCGFDNPYVFNLADIAIFAGAGGMILFTGQKNEA